MTRPHHALEGKVLEVFAKLRHKGRPHFVLVLPDGSRSYIPVAWTDVASNPESSAPPCSRVGSASDLLRLRQRVDCLLRRIEVRSGDKPKLANPGKPTCNSRNWNCGAQNLIRLHPSTNSSRPNSGAVLFSHLAQLILKVVPGLPTNPPPSTESKNHER